MPRWICSPTFNETNVGSDHFGSFLFGNRDKLRDQMVAGPQRALATTKSGPGNGQSVSTLRYRTIRPRAPTVAAIASVRASTAHACVRPLGAILWGSDLHARPRA